MHSPVRASEAVISLDRIRSLLANASGRVEFYTPANKKGYILNKIRVGRLFTFFENFFYLEYSDLLGNEIR